MKRQQELNGLSDLSEMTGAKIVGLTGGIASGKSTVARVMAGMGLPVVDADQIARDLNSEGGKAYPAIVQRFGTGDRREIRKLIFSDPAARRDLEAILHPLIQAESLIRIHIAAARSQFDPAWVAYEAALLVETGRYRDFDALIVVDAPRELRRVRLIARDGLEVELADAILNAQAGDAERLAAATFVISNSGDLDALRRETASVIAKLTGGKRRE